MALKGVNKARPDLRISASDTAGPGASNRGVERSKVNDKKTEPLKQSGPPPCISKMGGGEGGGVREV